MTETERLARLRHDLANPLGALLAEAQLLLEEAEGRLDPEALASLREIESLALKLRAILRET